MSDFQRKLFQNKLALAEQQLGLALGDEEEGEEDTVPELAPLPSFAPKRPRAPPSSTFAHKDASFVEKLPKWSDFFDNNDIFREPDSGYCFQTYYSPPIKGKQVEDVPANDVVFVCHHGAGSSGLTFAKLAESIKRQTKIQRYDSTPGVFTFDMRGHGNTMLLNKDGDAGKLSLDMSIDRICKDFVFVFEQFLKKHFAGGRQPSVFLLGHSLGGAVLTKVVHDRIGLSEEVFKEIRGLVMVDIVEDTAVNALASMGSYLRGVPQQFHTMEAAIDWHLKTGLLNNRRSAVVSVPSLVHKEGPTGPYRWVTDLKKTSPYWDHWFTGLSANFTDITGAIAKLLILVNNDYLDKDLMIGQMQGKYQLMVFHNAQLQLETTLTTQTKTVLSQDSDKLGHFVHEDIPDKVAISLLEFVERNDYKDFSRIDDTAVSSKLDMLSKLNAKWGVKN